MRRAFADWLTPRDEWGDRGLRAVLFLALLALLMIGVPLLAGTEVIL
jgi:hypothetical protein